MNNDDYNITTDENGCIRNGLRADIMRCCMENKNLLAVKGSIYVGTGETIVKTGPGDDIEIAKTKALNPGNSGELLMVKDGKLGYFKLTEVNFAYNSSGIVAGDVGNGSHPVSQVCNCLKPNLYTTISSTFSSGVCEVSVPVDFTMIHVSIERSDNAFLNRTIWNIDFGFLYHDPSINMSLFSATMFPVNWGDRLFITTTTKYGNYVYIKVESGQDTGRLKFTLGGPGIYDISNILSSSLSLKVFS